MGGEFPSPLLHAGWTFYLTDDMLQLFASYPPVQLHQNCCLFQRVFLTLPCSPFSSFFMNLPFLGVFCPNLLVSARLARLMDDEFNPKPDPEITKTPPTHSIPLSRHPPFPFAPFSPSHLIFDIERTHIGCLIQTSTQWKRPRLLPCRRPRPWCSSSSSSMSMSIRGRSRRHRPSATTRALWQASSAASPN